MPTAPALLPAALLLVACGGPPSRPSPDETSAGLLAPTPAHLPLDAPDGLADAVGKPVSIEARDLVLRLEGAEVHVAYLSGHLTPTEGGQIVDLESPRSFEVTVDALEVRIPSQTLQSAMGGGSDAPFSDLAVRTEGDSLLLDGHLKTLHLPFSFRADPTVTPRGSLGLELEKVKLLGIGVKGFLGAFQKPIEKAANQHGHLLDVDEHWLVINPFPFAGPPAIHAAFTSVEVRDHDIVARLGELSRRDETREAGGVTLEGGALRSKRSVFFDVTLRLVAQDGGALIIDPANFDQQMAGGVVKNMPDGNIVVYVLAPGVSPIEPVVRPAGGPEEPKTPAE